jgi:pyruvate kinase
MKNRRTKIIVTLGPACSTPAMIERLVRAGADVVRLNFSHGTLGDHDLAIRRVRSAAARLARPIPILADLPGPKLRTGRNQHGTPVHLRAGAKVLLTTRPVLGTSESIPIAYKPLPRFLKRGERVLLADGLLELKVLRSSGTEILCRVVTGGELGEHKGINLPGLRLPIPALSDKDREAIRFLVRANVEYIALSFVQRASDVESARALIRKLRGEIPLIAKIEKPQALEQIDSILDVSDGLLIARGDLGVEVPTAHLPVVQKELIRLAARRSVPIITATQMLDSMVSNPRPTRAETTDVANAIWDGSDAVMLTNETAAGKYPVEAVKMMATIVEEAESHPDFQWAAPLADESKGDSHAILAAATRVAGSRSHKVVVAYTQTGRTAVALSKMRPAVPIVALTPDPATYRRLGLIWGVRPFLSPHGHNVNQMIRIGDQVLVKKAGFKRNDLVILVAGTRLSSGATNFLKIHQIGQDLTGKQRRR